MMMDHAYIVWCFILKDEATTLHNTQCASLPLIGIKVYFFLHVNREHQMTYQVQLLSLISSTDSMPSSAKQQVALDLKKKTQKKTENVQLKSKHLMEPSNQTIQRQIHSL